MEPADHPRHDVRQPAAFSRAADEVGGRHFLQHPRRPAEDACSTQGIVTRADDPSHKQKGIYSLTEQGIELLPVLAQMAAWGFKYLDVTEELGIRARLLSEGGPKMWAEFMDELRETHLGARRRRKAGPGRSASGCRRRMRRSWRGRGSRWACQSRAEPGHPFEARRTALTRCAARTSG